ncbi:ATP-dependent DNA helicase DinG [Zobellella denitrificans]|uniref:ATP-dependent DNA helicase DinG n=1 Tax=Zobellella denitrificans TaxID=347534 RepID=A0A291HPQ4_9GAMM|nr:ATP-dependent DNA helicase DinG [Zobellella denitrificans]ATG74112.1 ATP-dependent DNA helicase DinG [Zobellella denitrificans]
MARADYRTLVRDNYRRLSQSIQGFTPRREQNYLVAEIGKVLLGHYDSARRILVAEAGTGIGKSLAYLQAAIPWARLNQKKVIVSTATLALQEQLVNKDLPLFQPHCQPGFTFTLAKGRARYCCVRWLEALALGENQLGLFEAAAGLTPAQQQQLAGLWQAWCDQRWPGDRDSWPEPIDDSLWQQLQAERHSCQPLLGHRHCPFHLARAEIDKSDVVVVNHALLLADLAMGGGVLLPEPEQCLYILDEAHHIAAVAREQGSARLPLGLHRRALEQFNKQLGGVHELLGEEGQPRLARLQQALQQLIPALNQLYRQLSSALSRQELTPDEQGCLRFTAGELPGFLLEALVSLKEDNKLFARSLERVQAALGEQLKRQPAKAGAIEAALAALSQQQLRAEQTRDLCELMLRAGHPKQPPPARWLEQDRQELTLCATPLAVGHLLEQWCWSRAAAAILVSATLTALNDFGYFRRAVGLRANDGSRYLRLDSPFDYQSARLILPRLDCEPTDARFDQLLCEQIPAWLEGQTASLVLFSSYRQMQAVAEALRGRGQSLLVQGEASRQALLQLHKQRCDGNQPSVLFGTGSFAEGLDLPGHYLTNLIITKLPFAVPTSPVEEAMAEWVSLCGGNPFMQLAMPEASRKLIQACGRLLRTETDHGRIVLLDKRLVSRRYGAALLDALPPFSRELP